MDREDLGHGDRIEGKDCDDAVPRPEEPSVRQTLAPLIADQTVDVYIPLAARGGQVQLLEPSDALSRLAAGNRSPTLLAAVGYELEGLVQRMPRSSVTSTPCMPPRRLSLACRRCGWWTPRATGTRGLRTAR